MRVAFRTDASATIGSGHVMRCVTLARKLREERANVLFVCRQHSGNMSEWIEAQGFPVARLAAGRTDLVSTSIRHEWLGAEPVEDAIATIDAMADRAFAADWIVVDHYALDAGWETALRRDGRRIMVIDDLADRQHDCDVIVDQNLVAEFAARYDALVPPGAVKLLGPQYALLQPEYATYHASAQPRRSPPRRILVYFGASDPDNLSGLTLDAFLALGHADIQLDLVIGPINRHAPTLREAARGRANVTLHEQLPSLAELMLQADLAIGAGGATSWERLCLKLPAIVGVLAENQRPVVAELHRRGLATSLGDAASIDAVQMRAAIAAQIDGRAAHAVDVTPPVDGLGVDRVCAALMASRATLLAVRPATPGDEDLLLEWANDPQTRANSFNPERITPEGHKGWFSGRLAEPERCRFYIVETVRGLPVGQVRFDKTDDHWAIDYAAAPQLRGQGLGATILEAAIAEFSKTATEATLMGEVIAQNAASRKVFCSLGFAEREDKGIWRYTKSVLRDRV